MRLRSRLHVPPWAPAISCLFASFIGDGQRIIMRPLKCWLYLPSEPCGQSNSSLRNSSPHRRRLPIGVLAWRAYSSSKTTADSPRNPQLPGEILRRRLLRSDHVQPLCVRHIHIAQDLIRVAGVCDSRPLVFRSRTSRKPCTENGVSRPPSPRPPACPGIPRPKGKPYMTGAAHPPSYRIRW